MGREKGSEVQLGRALLPLRDRDASLSLCPPPVLREGGSVQPAELWFCLVTAKGDQARIFIEGC